MLKVFFVFFLVMLYVILLFVFEFLLKVCILKNREFIGFDLERVIL